MKQIIEDLRNDIRRHDTMYYVYGAPSITDAEYDKLFKHLLELEEKHPEFVTLDSPSQRVGGEPVDKLTAVAHAVPMLSIANGFDLSEMEAFHKRVKAQLKKEPTYFADYKVDGCALSLIYRDGVLVRAVTRGDGKRGDDVTHNARCMRGVPNKLVLQIDPEDVILPCGKIDLSGEVEIRGEAYISNSDFILVREAQVAAGEEPFANARNAASGALRAHDPKECWKRKVSFVAHGIVSPTATVDDSYFATMWTLNAYGIPVVANIYEPSDFATARCSVDMLIEQVGEIEYPIDGIVLKLDKFSDREAMGQTSTKNVSWALAYKWERYEAETTVESIDIQVGKKGTLTPVAYLKPVEIAETIVKKASLHNFDEIDRLGLQVGDTVVVEKAGKIIPHIMRVSLEKRAKDAKVTPYVRPTKCPLCGATVKNVGVGIRCTNSLGCSAQLHALLLSAADRTRLDIDGLGEKLLTQLMEHNYITKFTDLWRLDRVPNALLALPGVGAKKVTKLLSEIAKSKGRPAEALLACFNIEHVGRTVSKQLMAHFGTIEKLAKASIGELHMMSGIGPETAGSLIAWFKLKRNKDMIAELKLLGVNLGEKDPKPVELVVDDKPGPLTGKKLCATGKLVGYSRQDIGTAILKAGGTVASSISKATDYLVAGEDAGSKLTKAQELGVKVLTETEFNQLIGVN